VIAQIRSGGTLTTALQLSSYTMALQQIKALCPQIDGNAVLPTPALEPLMGAVRTARGFTGRQRMVTVEGGFHGLYDELMWKSDIESWDAHSGQAPKVIPLVQVFLPKPMIWWTSSV
jgi:glutamate-1-semialdehyde 2,1-aminomutase